MRTAPPAPAGPASSRPRTAILVRAAARAAAPSALPPMEGKAVIRRGGQSTEPRTPTRKGDAARSCVMGAVRGAGTRHAMCECTGTGQEG